MLNDNKVYLLFMIILFIGLIFTGCSNNLSSPNFDDNTYTISGKVTDSSNNPIKDVILNFSGYDEVARTGSEGKWQKSGLTGKVEVIPADERYEFFSCI